MSGNTYGKQSRHIKTEEMVAFLHEITDASRERGSVVRSHRWVWLARVAGLLEKGRKGGKEVRLQDLAAGDVGARKRCCCCGHFFGVCLV